LAAPEDGGGLPSAATIVLARSGFRQKAAEIPRPSWLGGDFRSALPPRHRRFFSCFLNAAIYDGREVIRKMSFHRSPVVTVLWI